MKRIISLLLALSMLFVLCACGADTETLLTEADAYLASYASETYGEETGYIYIGEYNESMNQYDVFMSIDIDYVEEKAKNALAGYNTAGSIWVMLLDGNEEYIASELDNIGTHLQKHFDKSDIVVRTGYVNYSGEYSVHQVLG